MVSAGRLTPDVCLATFALAFLRLSEWLEKGRVKKLVLVITGEEQEEVLERSIAKEGAIDTSKPSDIE